MMYGVVFGIVMVLEFTIAYVMNIDPASHPMVGTMMNTLNYCILPILFISLACQQFKKGNDGFASFGECLKTGVVVCVVGALIYSVFYAIFVTIFPDFIPETMEKVRSITIQKSPDVSQKQLDMILSWTEKMMHPIFAVPITLIMYSFLGLIWSLIVGAIVKKDRPAFI